MRKFDVIVIGAGVVGSCIARLLSRYKISVALLEKEEDTFSGQSRANSGIVHPGFHEDPGTLKAKLCVEGNLLYSEICRELDVPFKRCGAFVVALNKREENFLEKLKEKGKQNKIPGLRILKGDAIFSLEPNLTRKVKSCLYAPTAGIVSPYELTIALLENARQNGVEFYPGRKVKEISPCGDSLKKVKTSRGIFYANYIVNAAGVFADDIATYSKVKIKVIPCKGEEYILDRKVAGFVKHIIYPVPERKTKGVLVIPTVEGNLIIGPTSSPVKDKGNVSTTQEGLEFILKKVRRFFPALDCGKIIASYAGVRASTRKRDFLIAPSKKVRGFINLIGIDSPGLTAAPAIARMVASLLKKEGLNLVPKKDFYPYRRWIRFRELSQGEKEELIKKDIRYANIVCRCENVTEAEIVEAIKRGACTLDGIKFRTRAGMGRCQGGFCTPGIIKIMAREMGFSPEEITKKGKGSRILWKKSKG